MAPADKYLLYYSPGSCSLVIHCLLEELGVAFDAKRVDLERGEYRGEAYRRINPKGKVPALVTPEGVLTECVAIVEYLCDRHDDGRLLGKPGSWQRARTLERMATIATELHPLFNRFFHEDDFSDEAAVRASVKAHGTRKLVDWFRAEDAALESDGSSPTAADFYFMVVSRWGRFLDPPAIRMKRIEPFFRRMTERPAVRRAMAREGIKAFGS